MAERKNNSGALFANDRKEKDTHPDSKGSAMIDGKEYWISGWTKTGEKGKFISLSFEPKEAKAAPATPSGNDEAIPF